MKKKGCGKLILAGLILALVVGGCAGLQQAGQNVENFICDPPASVVNLVNLAEPFILAAFAAAVPDSAEYIQAYEAYGGMVAIQAGRVGLCATIKQINALIALLSGDRAKTFRIMAMAPAFDVTPLKDWLKAKGK